MRSPLLFLVLFGAAWSAAGAQTDFYNTDAGRPLATEDAYAIEHRAFEWQLAPLRFERARGITTWALEPGLTYGVLPRTQLQVGVPVHMADAPGRRTSGVAGLDVSVLHNLNIETLRLPALALGLHVLAPAGTLAPDGTFATVKAVATRTLRVARFHLNGAYTLGGRNVGFAGDLSRWFAGLAIDRTWPLRSVLVAAELNATRPIIGADGVEWTTAAGVRKQLTPQVVMDAGAGRRLSGATGWFGTVGLAYVFGRPE